MYESRSALLSNSITSSTWHVSEASSLKRLIIQSQDMNDVENNSIASDLMQNMSSIKDKDFSLTDVFASWNHSKMSVSSCMMLKLTEHWEHFRNCCCNISRDMLIWSFMITHIVWRCFEQISVSSFWLLISLNQYKKIVMISFDIRITDCNRISNARQSSETINSLQEHSDSDVSIFSWQTCLEVMKSLFIWTLSVWIRDVCTWMNLSLSR